MNKINENNSIKFYLFSIVFDVQIFTKNNKSIFKTFHNTKIHLKHVVEKINIIQYSLLLNVGESKNTDVFLFMIKGKIFRLN